MADVNFRKIDIDIYDEDALQESDIYETDPRDPGQVLAEAKQKQTAVRSALARYASQAPIAFSIRPNPRTTRNDVSGALQTVLQNAPFGPGVDEAKVWLSLAHTYT
jgi:actin related protein 2/3 complex subunit 5